MAPCTTKPDAFYHQVSVSPVARLNNTGFCVILYVLRYFFPSPPLATHITPVGLLAEYN